MLEDASETVVSLMTSSVLRLVGTVLGFLIYIFLSPRLSHPHLVLGLIIAAVIHALYLHLNPPDEKKKTWEYASIAVDLSLLLTACFATGGYDSPFHPFIALAAASSALRHGPALGWAVTGYLGLGEIGLFLLQDAGSRPVADLAVRLVVLGMMTYLCVQVSRGALWHLQGRRGADDVIENMGNLMLGQGRDLEAAESRLKGILAHSEDLVWELERDSHLFSFVSPRAEGLLGYPAERWLKEPDFGLSLIHPEDRARVEGLRVQAGRDGKEFTCEYRVYDSQGREVWLHESVYPGFDATGHFRTLRGLARDITTRRKAEAEIVFQSHHDGLTGLPNRGLFMDRLTVALAQARRLDHMVAVLVVNLDRFKSLNDGRGYAAGDQALRQISDRLRTLLREGDTLARLGGDEFGLILTQTVSSQDVAAAAEAIRQSFHNPLDLEGREFHMGASIGISLYPSDGSDAEALLKCADVAVFDAKEAGRGGHRYYSPSLNAQTLQHLAMESSLRRALKEKEFTVHYQPQVDLKTGQISGAEALLRWRHPEMGLVFPAEFIALAETTGLVTPIGEAMLREACAQWKIWTDSGLTSCRLFVNLSGRQFQDEDLVNRLTSIVGESGLEARHLGIEITESVAMKNVRYTRDTLARLHEKGLEVALDDFGTGYSSLSYLKLFPIHILKIDKSFIRDLGTDSNDEAISRAVISLGKSLKLKVLAEGVENYVQLEFLRRNDCDLAQGYLYERPLPPEEFAKFLKNPTLKTSTALGRKSADSR